MNIIKGRNTNILDNIHKVNIIVLIKKLIFLKLIIFLFLTFFNLYFYFSNLFNKVETKNGIFDNIYKNQNIYNQNFKKKDLNLLSIKFFSKLINDKKRSSIKWPLPKEIKFRPIMTSNELKVFCYFMKPGNTYFEFGSGGSTNIASFYKIKTYSVESDIKWHKKLKENNIKANYITIDLKSKSLGFPGNQTNIDDWKKYIQAYNTQYNADIILIDGRFRVACGLDIFSKIRKDTLVLVHDYTNREKYHILEKYYFKLKTWDSLALFIKNPNKQISKNIYQKLYLR